MSEATLKIYSYQKGPIWGWINVAGRVIDFSPLALEGSQPLPRPLEIYKVKLKRRRTVYRTQFPSPGTRRGDMCIKRYGFGNYFYLISGWLFGSYAKNSWKAANLMCQEGIGTPLPVALLEAGSFGKKRRRFFITVALEGVVPLERLLPRLPSSGHSSLIQELAAFLAHLHQKGFYHADLEANNLLVEQTGGHFRFYLVDLDRTKRLSWLPFFILDIFRLADLRKFFKTLKYLLTMEERGRLFDGYFAAISRSKVRKKSFSLFL